jgi:hypothetical protein
MVNTAVLKVPLAEGVALDDGDREVLEAMTQALAGMRRGAAPPWTDVVKALQADGWEVRARVGWIAEARRGTTHERAVADSRDEALHELLEMTMLDAVEGCP